MAKVMLIDATHPEETRVAVADGRKLEEFDVEIASRRPLKGNIYLAKVTRVEPSLQAAFVEYGGNRHGFLAFSEIHPDYYRIPVADREALLRDAAEEEDEIDAAEAEEQPAQSRSRERGGRNRRDRGRHRRSSNHGERGSAAEAELEAGSAAEVSIGDDRDQPGAWDAAGQDAPYQPTDDLQPAYDETDDTAEFSPDTDISAGAEHDDAPSDTADDAPWGAGDEAEQSREPLEQEPMALETPRFELRGEPLSEGPASEGEMPATIAGEPAGAVFETAHGNGEAELPAPAHGELVEVQTSEEVFDVVGGEEPAQQDDPELDEEQARRRRLRNLRRYKIQEVIKRRQILLVQVTKEERGNKGAALTTYLSLAGRYCVLMPNTDRGGGISRRITSVNDRKRLKSIIDDLDAPDGMAVIVRTAGMERAKPEIKRDFEYLLRLWDEIREVTLKSTAPALIYEEASLIKRSIRDLYTRDIGDIVVAGDEAYRAARAFMRALAPSHLRRVQHYRDPSQPLFQRYQIESQISAIHEPVVHLKSGGYIVINQTEALVAIDVNSGRATRERNIEETALRTNSEAAEEVARQLRLRDLAGLIVIDFIDMEENRNNAAVERRLKEALKNDRARIQIGRISTFGLLEMSRQRLHPSLVEASTEMCPHCRGSGRVRSVESTALHVLRMVEEEIARSFSPGATIFVPTSVALFILNHKRTSIDDIEQRRGVRLYLQADDELTPPEYRLERIKMLNPGEEVVKRIAAPLPEVEEEEEELPVEEFEAEEVEAEAPESTEEEAPGAASERGGGGRRRRRRRGRGGKFRADEFTESSGPEDGAEAAPAPQGETAAPVEHAAQEFGGDEAEDSDEEVDGAAEGAAEGSEEIGADGQPRRRRRRGRRGGRRRSRRGQEQGVGAEGAAEESGQAEAPVPGLGEQPDLPDEMPVQWAQRVAPLGSFEPAPESVAASAEPALAAAPEEEPQAKRRTRRPRRREDEPALETVGAESVAATAPVPEPSPAPYAAPVQGVTSGGTEVGAEPSGEPQTKRGGWWRRLIE
jgi:ribonuclease E